MKLFDNKRSLIFPVVTPTVDLGQNIRKNCSFSFRYLFVWRLWQVTSGIRKLHHDEPQVRLLRSSEMTGCAIQNRGVVDRTSETALRRSQKMPHVNHGFSAVTFINKRYFIFFRVYSVCNGFVLLIIEDLSLDKSPCSIKWKYKK